MKSATSHPAPVVSIIVPVFNKADLTIQCLTALAKNTSSVSHEVIVVDNASSDNTQERVRVLPGPVRLIRNEANLGFANACNQGAAAAKGKYRLFLNNDTVPCPGWLEPLVQELQSHPSVVAAGSRLLYGGGLVQHAGVAFARETRIPYHPYRFLIADDPRVNRRRELQAVTAACLIIRPEWFERCGGFNQEFINGYEDLDLCLNIRRRGGTIVYQPRSVVYHLESQSAGRLKHDDRNRALFFRNWRDWLLSDEDAYYAVDDYKIVHRRFGGQLGSRLARITNGAEREQWRVVGDCQQRAAEGRRQEVIDLLQKTDQWPSDAGVRRWAGVVCQRLGLPKTAAIHWHAAQSDEPVPECAIAFASAGVVPDFDKHNGFAPWVAACSEGFAAVEGRDPEAAAKAFHRARVQGLNPHTALQLEGEAAHRAGDLATARQCALALLARHRGDPAGLRLLDATEPNSKQKQPSKPTMNHQPLGRQDNAVTTSSPNKDVVSASGSVAEAAGVKGSPTSSRHSSCQSTPTDLAANREGPPTVKSLALEIDTPLRSVIVLTRNQLMHTRKCVESILAHTSPPFELIMVDNGSTDGTPAYLQELQGRYPFVRVILNQENRGFAAGNNQGIAIAKGEFVLLLNNDTVVTPGWLDHLIAPALNDPKVGLVGPMSNRVAGPQLEPKPDYESLDQLPAFARQWTTSHHGQTTPVNRLVGFCLLIRREVINQIGGLDEQFGSGNFEDDDYCLRARFAGYRACIARDVFIHHEGSQTFKGEKIDYRQAMLANWKKFSRKWRLSGNLETDQGYLSPSTAPAGLKLTLPLPSPNALPGHKEDPSTGSAPEAEENKSNTTPLYLPKVASLGNLDQARATYQRHEFQLAWNQVGKALEQRPFHPEAYLLLAEIAKSAGDLQQAHRCADRAAHMAPNWKAAKRLAKQLPNKTPSNSTVDAAWPALPKFARNGSAEPRLTVCLIVKNEEQFLDQCLRSVKEIADQIVVVDTGSTDRTAEIAREHGAELHSHEWNDDFAAARNEALTHARGDWVLVIDADEELSPEHRQTLRKEIRAPQAMAYRLPISDHGHEQLGHHCVPRLFRNVPGAFFSGRIHEQAFESLEPSCAAWGLEIALGKTLLIHHGYSQDLTRSRDKVARNLHLLKLAIQEKPENPNLRMNLGLELVRDGSLEEGLQHYSQAFQALNQTDARQGSPELREALLTQYSTHLLKADQPAEVIKLLSSRLAKQHPLTSSLQLNLGLALFQLDRFENAAAAFRSCLAHRKQQTFTPANPEIQGATPHHCLALCLLAMGEIQQAKAAYTDALQAEPANRKIRLDYARFLNDNEQALDALKLLHEMVSTQGDDPDAWVLGGQIALGQTDFLDFATDWTGEAVKFHPANDRIRQQRAEALLLGGELDTARALWAKTESDLDPRGSAGRLVASLAADPDASQPLEPPADEEAVSRQFLQIYRRLLETQGRALIPNINRRLDELHTLLPTAARLLESALAEANRE